MYHGSAEFETANSQPIQRHTISGTIDGLPFTADDVLLGSVSITNQCSDQVDAQIGAVYIGQLSITFLPHIGITPTTWRGREIVISFSLLTDEDPETRETFPLGVFTVSEAERTLQGYQITAYDNMSKFDKPVTWDYLPAGTLYSVLSGICTNCGVSLGMNESDCEALPNGDWPNISMYPGSNVQTYRDILYWLSQMVAGFATCDRSGRLVLRSYKTILEAAGDAPELPQDRRLTGASISDYVTNFRGVTLYSMKDEESHYYGSPLGSGIVYDLGANPFMQYGTALTISDMAMNVANAIKYNLRPFTASIMSAPVWELGDRLMLSGGIAAGYETVTCIHAITYNHGKGTQLQCFGQDPALVESGTQNKDKAAASNTARQNITSYRRYANGAGITVATIPEKVAEITFTAEKNTDFEVWHEILLTSALDPGETSMELEAVYYLDGQELIRKPVETYSDSARHILTLNYSAEVQEGNHLWEVYLVAAGGTANININDSIAVLHGQGLSRAETWDGVIYLTDDVASIPMLLGLSTVSETSLQLTLSDYESISLSENVANIDMTMEPSEITETFNITLYQPAFPIEVEESASLIGAEEGGKYLETE